MSNREVISLCREADGSDPLIVVWLDVGPFAVVPDISAGVCFAVTLLVSACANYWYQNQNLVGESELPPELRRA